MQHVEHDQPASTGDVYQSPVVQRLGTLAELTLGGGTDDPDGTGLGSDVTQP
ncbi:lasso RiPP family leader peptide-containing protein [Micromonospora sp. NPDC051300]|uniref:lasso RiPP family leader peptide-containing protein n=1 Tax=Micromonospora sp. NPDC051300 TaxID=3364286 RepID=UPI0037A14525